MSGICTFHPSKSADTLFINDMKAGPSSIFLIPNSASGIAMNKLTAIKAIQIFLITLTTPTREHSYDDDNNCYGH